MKKIMGLIIIVFFVLLISCGEKKEVIVLTSKEPIIYMYINDEKPDYKSYITLTSNDIVLPVEDSMIDDSNIDYSTIGTYELIVTYKSSVLFIEVKIQLGTLLVMTTCEKVIVNLNEEIDFTKYFEITLNDKPITVDISMINTNDFDNTVPGTYTVTLETKIHGHSASVDLIFEVINPSKEVKINALEDNLRISVGTTYDFTTLFEILVDDEFVEVTSDMLNLNGFNKDVSGEYTISINYVYNDVTYSKSVSVIVFDEVILETTVDLVYFSHEVVDFTVYFTITVNGENIVVTNSMIDFTNLNPLINGEYTITLEYVYKDVLYKKDLTVIVQLDEEEINSIEFTFDGINQSESIQLNSYVENDVEFMLEKVFYSTQQVKLGSSSYSGEMLFVLDTSNININRLTIRAKDYYSSYLDLLDDCDLFVYIYYGDDFELVSSKKFDLEKEHKDYIINIGDNEYDELIIYIYSSTRCYIDNLLFDYNEESSIPEFITISIDNVFLFDFSICQILDINFYIEYTFDIGVVVILDSVNESFVELIDGKYVYYENELSEGTELTFEEYEEIVPKFNFSLLDKEDFVYEDDRFIIYNENIDNDFCKYVSLLLDIDYIEIYVDIDNNLSMINFVGQDLDEWWFYITK